MSESMDIVQMQGMFDKLAESFREKEWVDESLGIKYTMGHSGDFHVQVDIEELLTDQTVTLEAYQLQSIVNFCKRIGIVAA